MNFSNLFSPIKIGSLEIKNRIVMAPMTMTIPGIRPDDGIATDRLISFWEARAKGGVGLIITDVISPDPEYSYMGPTHSLGTEAQRASMKRLTDAIHKHGTKIIPQLTHPGPASLRGLLYKQEVVGPSTWVNTQTGSFVRELSVEEIKNIVVQYGEAAKKARECGFDGVEVHCAHAYALLGCFLSPARNKRVDEYGGALKSRMKFPLEVIAEIKKKAGNDFPIVVRLSGDEIIEDGNHWPDMVMISKLFAEAGVDALEVSGGAFPEHMEVTIPCHGMPLAINAEYAKKIKEVVNIPVLSVGGIREPEMAESLIQTGKADMVVMGRALLADPELPNKTRNGDLDDIAPCTGCCDGCMNYPSTTCVINPLVGKEIEPALTRADKPKKVVVIGGGPGGMQAAIDCTLRGHKVILLEKDDHLGGMLVAASRPPFKQEVAKWVKYLIHKTKVLNIDVRFHQEGNAETLNRHEPDAIIVATGSDSIVPNVVGIENIETYKAIDVLNGKVAITGGNVLIIGGGMVALETADLLARNLNPTTVTLVARRKLEDVGKEYFAGRKKLVLKTLKEKCVAIKASTTIKEISEGCVIANDHGSDVNLGSFSHVVLACGFNSNYSDDKYKGLAKEVFVIGDAVKPRTALEAIAEAADVARKI